MSYTPAPWHEGFRTDDGRNICAPETGRVIAIAKSDDDARRIVACVNACEGLSQHYLETLHPSHSSLAREMEILRNNMEAAQRERDVMRAALASISALKASDFSGAHDLSAECFVIASTAMRGDVSAWQPIETAPKDGKMILLGRAASEDCAPISVPGFWQEGCEDGVDYMGNDSGFVDVNFQQFHGGRSFGAENRRYAPNQPTHWMPLPGGPA